MRRMGFLIISHVSQAEEKLPKFFKALKHHQGVWYIKESAYMSTHYRCNFTDPDTVEKLAKECTAERTHKRSLIGLPWYNILCNPTYVRDFNYIPVANDNRDKLIDSYTDAEQDKKYA